MNIKQNFENKTTINIGKNNNQIIKKQLNNLKREEAKQQCQFLINEQDEKQFISKDESEMLRDSILQLNRPRINRPPWEIIENSNPNNNILQQTSINIKKDEEDDSSKNGTTFLIRSSNSSTSGCSSNPQSGSCSPIVFNNNNGNNFLTKINNEKQIEKQQNIDESEQKRNDRSLNTTTKIISASLIQNALLKNGVDNLINTKQYQKFSQTSQINATTNVNTPSTTTTTTSTSTSTTYTSSTSSNSYSSIYSKNSPLKRKEFSASRRQIIQNQKNEEEKERILQKENQLKNWQQQRAVDTVEEVKELGRAALQQMAILEELEFEDLERKTKINDRLSLTNNRKHSPTSSTNSSISNGYNKIKQISNPSSSITTISSPILINSKESQINNPSQLSSTKITSHNQQLNKQPKKLPAPIIDKNKLITLTNPSLQSLATSIIRYDDERRKENNQEKIKLITQSPPVEPPKFSAQSISNLIECKECKKPITNVVLQALGASFHPACFRCKKCSRCLDGIPFTINQNGEGVICMDDYERHFVTYCNACKKPINAVNEFGKIVRIVTENREYHVNCYCCEVSFILIDSLLN